MKKLLLLAVVALFGMTATNAQVKLGLGFGYAIPSGDIADFTDGGLAAHLELGYGVTEDIDVSIIYHGEFLAGGDVNGLSVGAVAIGSYMLNGRYYFTKEGFRPYGSLGLGLASIGSVEFDEPTALEDAQADTSTSNFAFRPALGFKYGVLNMNVAYLSAGKSGDATVNDITVNLGLLFTFGGK